MVRISLTTVSSYSFVFFFGIIMYKKATKVIALGRTALKSPLCLKKQLSFQNSMFKRFRTNGTVIQRVNGYCLKMAVSCFHTERKILAVVSNLISALFKCSSIITSVLISKKKEGTNGQCAFYILNCTVEVINSKSPGSSTICHSFFSLDMTNCTCSRRIIATHEKITIKGIRVIDQS